MSTIDVSRRALSIARMIDRLPPGKFNLVLEKGLGEGERWQIEIAQAVTLQKKDLVHEPENKIVVELKKESAHGTLYICTKCGHPHALSAACVQPALQHNP